MSSSSGNSPTKNSPYDSSSPSKPPRGTKLTSPSKSHHHPNYNNSPMTNYNNSPMTSSVSPMTNYNSPMTNSISSMNESSGVLLRVLRSLLSSASSAHREATKRSLEGEYREIDKNLDSLISTHSPQLNQVMLLFSTLSSKISEAKRRVEETKNRLIECRTLLSCRREELGRLWTEGLLHKHSYQLLSLICELRGVPESVNKSLSKKQYLNGAKTLMFGIGNWNESVESIEGLSELKTQLKTKREKLYGVLLDELNEELFSKRSLKLNEMRSNFIRFGSERQSSGRNLSLIKARKIFLDITPSTGEEEKGSDVKIKNIIECVATLKFIPRLREELRSQLEEKLEKVVKSITESVIEMNDGPNEPKSDSAILTQFLITVFRTFTTIVESHTEILSLLKRNEEKKSEESLNSLTVKNIWTIVQTVLQTTLKNYFETPSSSLDNEIVDEEKKKENNGNYEINSYFQKKKQPKQKKEVLFKFQYSLHGLNISNDGDDGSRFLVCKPNPQNILLIYNLIQEFISQIESSPAYPGGEECELRVFLSSNVNTVFLDHLYKDLLSGIEMSKKEPESWRETTLHSPSNLKILKCFHVIGKSVSEMIEFSSNFPTHSDELFNLLNSILTSFLTHSSQLFTSLTSSLISSTMVNDDDVERLLKSLPNWKNYTKMSINAHDENLKEADLFYGLFGGKILAPHEVLLDIPTITQIAQIHLSLEWMSNILKRESSDGGEMSRLDEVSKLFSNLSSSTLLFLYFELRVHSFYYLSPLTSKYEWSPTTEITSPHFEITEFEKDLLNYYAALSPYLDSHKLEFVFDGLSDVMRRILMKGVSEIRRMNEIGVRRMLRDIYTLQQTISQISTKPQPSFHSLKQYYQIFLHSIQDLFDSLLEKGPEFKENEYMSAVQLLFRTKSTPPPVANEYLTRLSNILGDIGVTI